MSEHKVSAARPKPTRRAVAELSLTSSQVIELRDLRPLVIRWLFASAYVSALGLAFAAGAALAASAWAASREPEVWAVLPRGDVLSITPLHPTSAMVQQMTAQGVGR